jgi:methyl-accepting chemotaxis protein
VFDLYEGTPRDVIRSLMGSQPGNVSNTVFIVKGRSLLTAAAPISALGWRLFVSTELPVRMPVARSVILIAVPVVALGLLLLALAWIALARLTPLFTRIRLLEQEHDVTLGRFQEIAAAALRAHSAADGLNALAGALAKEATDAAQSGKAAADLFSLAESRDEELRSGMASRLSLLTQITSAARQAIERARATREPAAAIGRNAADVEERLSRVIASGASVSRAVEKALKESEAMGQAGDRLKLLSLNAALEASRSGGQQLSRITGEISGQAEDAVTRARVLSAALAEAGSSMENVAHAAQEAGRIVHETANASSEIARAVDDAGEGAETLFARMESANANAELVRTPASTADRGRSAMEGIIRIIARIGTLAGEVTGMAARVSADCAQAARPAAAAASAAASGESSPQRPANS